MQIMQSASRDPALDAQADLRALLGARCLLIVCLAHRTKIETTTCELQNITARWLRPKS
jgi:hypothetical protein